jgi:hypothetical protein
MNCQPGTRVLLMNLRARLRDIIVDALANEPDFSFTVGELKSERELEWMSGDVLIVEVADPNDTELPLRLLYEAPEMSVLMISISGETAAMYQLRPHRKPMGNLTAQGLMAAIRMNSAGLEARMALGPE